MNYEFKESDVFAADSFAEMGLADALVSHMRGTGTQCPPFGGTQRMVPDLLDLRVDKMQLSKPTHIQRASTTHLLEGKDVYGHDCGSIDV